MASRKKVQKGIFREYDIRGVVGKDLTTEVATLIGRSFGTHLQLKEAKRLKISVGRDIRLSSDSLVESLIRGITSTGVDVVDLGVCLTPLLYFSLHNLEVDGGVMVTGSHNPPEFNGFKLCRGKETIYGEEIQVLRDIIERDDFKKGRGGVETYDMMTPYRALLLNSFSSLKSMRRIKVVVDSGNGTCGIIAPQILRDINCEVVELFTEPDGRFPNHHPDPTVLKNLKDLRSTVREEGADLGVAYDGDGDRIGVVDEDGEVIWGDKLMILYARDIIESERASMSPVGPSEKPTVIGDVKCSQIMYDDIEKRGGRAIMWKTGHSLIKAKMKEVKALLAGEMSGHIFFADRYFGYDDAIYATLRIIEIVKKRPISVKGLLSDLPESHATPEIRVECPDRLKFEVVNRITKGFKEYMANQSILRSSSTTKDETAKDERTIELPEELTIKGLITIDGVRVILQGGWALIRASNTQPVVVLRFEADTEKRLNTIKGFFEGELERVMKEAIKKL